MGFDFTYFQPKGKIKYGFDVHGFSTDFTALDTTSLGGVSAAVTSSFSSKETPVTSMTALATILQINLTERIASSFPGIGY